MLIRRLATDKSTLENEITCLTFLVAFIIFLLIRLMNLSGNLAGPAELAKLDYLRLRKRLAGAQE